MLEALGEAYKTLGKGHSASPMMSNSSLPSVAKSLTRVKLILSNEFLEEIKKPSHHVRRILNHCNNICKMH
jgi:hypothetical protein